MRKFVDAEWLLRKLFPYDVVDKGSYAINAKAVYLAIEEAPAVDVVEVVRCKDCKWYVVHGLECHRPHCNGYMGMNDFCSYGERREK